MVGKSRILNGEANPSKAKRAYKTTEDKAFVNVVAKAVVLLFAFDGAQARLGNQEIARLTGLPKATVARLTYTMTRLGYLNYLPEDSKYKIGERAISLSGTMLRGMDFRFVVRPHLKELADYSSASCSIGICDQHSIMYIEHAESDEPVALRHSFGSRLPLLLPGRLLRSCSEASRTETS